MLVLQQIKRTDNRILGNMAIHYSQPKGFVGRNICYAVLWDNVYFGSIVGGSKLNNIINNIFFHVEKQNGKYPCRWFTVEVLSKFREMIIKDWELKYGDKVIGFESLVELPRTGDCYKKDGWDLIGQTVGYTCKRVGGKGTDDWSGKRIWDTKNLRPKLVFVKKC